MTKQYISSVVDDLILDHKTNDPYTIADALGIVVVDSEPLKYPTKGFYAECSGCRMIIINNMLSKNDKRIVCAHELGHAILHDGFNFYFLSSNTLFNMNRMEIEADMFCAFLLIHPDEIDLHDLNAFSIKQIAEAIDMPENLCEYALSLI